MSITPPRSVLFAGSYVTHGVGSRGVSEDVALRLEQIGWQVWIASRRAGRISRVAELLSTIWRQRER